MAPLGHAPFLDFSKKSLWKCSKVHFHTLIRFAPSPSQNGCRQWSGRTLMGGQKLRSSWIPQWQHGTSLLQQDAWSYRGDSSAAHLSLPQSSCRNLMPENRRACSSPKKLPAAFTEQAVWYLHQRFHTTSSFQQGCKPSLPHLLGMASKEKSFPPHLPHPTLGCFSVSPPSSTGPILWRSKNRGPSIGLKIQQHLWKR